MSRLPRRCVERAASAMHRIIVRRMICCKSRRRITDSHRLLRVAGVEATTMTSTISRIGGNRTAGHHHNDLIPRPDKVAAIPVGTMTRNRYDHPSAVSGVVRKTAKHQDVHHGIHRCRRQRHPAHDPHLAVTVASANRDAICRFQILRRRYAQVDHRVRDPNPGRHGNVATGVRMCPRHRIAAWMEQRLWMATVPLIPTLHQLQMGAAT
mmetsp:Transcript_19950/g.56520  ORF Transcript_19950/g.56520 Transcript_19950/m.56520 type:complete len:209 (-) Transcript_19950:74-700(-)